MPDDNKQRILQQAAALYGLAALAAGLHLDESLVASWMDGREVMPDAMLQSLAELLHRLAEREE